MYRVEHPLDETIRTFRTVGGLRKHAEGWISSAEKELDSWTKGDQDFPSGPFHDILGRARRALRDCGNDPKRILKWEGFWGNKIYTEFFYEYGDSSLARQS